LVGGGGGVWGGGGGGGGVRLGGGGGVEKRKKRTILKEIFRYTSEDVFILSPTGSRGRTSREGIKRLRKKKKIFTEGSLPRLIFALPQFSELVLFHSQEKGGNTLEGCFNKR